tara:strand:- start:11982 stop:12803 length:822 start_codon:yes stop_codon:yes gene_type:complete
MKKILFYIGAFAFSSTLLFSAPVYGQITEPEVERLERSSTTLSDHYKRGIGINFVMNNFGFGLGGEYRRIIAPQSELTASLRITGLRDASEQTFTDFFFGQQVIPNKYQRGIAIPLMLGMRKRVFADGIQNDFRFFVSASMGPAATFTYPYFDDINNNGYREQFQDFFEPVNDIFTGISEGDWQFGAAGEFKIALDIGENFTSMNSIEFGYFFYYYPDGVQIMMPNQPVIRSNVAPGESPFVIIDGELALEPFFEAQKFFGSPQITFTFGWLK